MKISQHNNGRRGFTLIEVMVAMGVFLMVIAIIYSTWAMVMRATQVGQNAAANAQRQRIALRTIEDALMCIQSFQASQRYYYFDVENGDAPVLSFVSRVPEVFPRNGKFGDFNLRRVTFALEGDEGGIGNGKNLVLRQYPVLMEMDEDEKKNPLILAHNVKKFEVECWDTNQLDWVTEWVDTNSIPPMLRVDMVLGGSSDPSGSAPDLTVVRAFTMPSQMMPAVVQRGGAGGPAGNNFIKLPGQ